MAPTGRARFSCLSPELGDKHSLVSELFVPGGEGDSKADKVDVIQRRLFDVHFLEVLFGSK